LQEAGGQDYVTPNKQFAMAGGVNKQPGKGHKEEVRDVVSQSKIFGFADTEAEELVI
jgi:hypothetical protein